MVGPPSCMLMRDGFSIVGCGLRLSGWIFMIISWTFILSMLVFCYSRIFKKDIGDGSEILKRLKK
jgi:hypothetical protein